MFLRPSEYEGLLETLDILLHKDELQAITRAKRQVRRCQTISLEEFKKKMAKR